MQTTHSIAILKTINYPLPKLISTPSISLSRVFFFQKYFYFLKKRVTLQFENYA